MPAPKPRIRKPKNKRVAPYDLGLNSVKEPTKDKPLLVAFTGKLASGKGTASTYVLSKFEGINMSWADALKLEVFDAILAGPMPAELAAKVVTPLSDSETIRYNAQLAFTNAPKCKTVLPTDKEKLAFINANKQTLRPLLQWWGTEFRRHQDPDYWIKKGVAKVKAALESGVTCIVNDDTRFLNEAQAMQSLGFTLVRIIVGDKQQEQRAIKRDGKFDPSVRTHASEIGLDTFYHTLTINNTGALHMLYSEVDKVVTKILNPSPRLKDFRCQVKPTKSSAPTSSTDQTSQ